MENRIKEIRLASGLTQDEFADRIGLSKRGVQAMEYGNSKVPSTTRRVICDEFGISREWLDTGEGDMYAPKPITPETVLTGALAEAYEHGSDTFRALVDTYLSLDETQREIFDKVVDRFALMRAEAIQNGTTAPTIETAAQYVMDSIENGSEQ